MQINLDPGKDASKRAKHGVSLAFAAEVLADADRLELLDARFDCTEERFVVYGLVEERVWVCVFTLRGGVHRIISVRKASNRETQRYRDTVR